MTDLKQLKGKEVMFNYNELDISIPCKIINAYLEVYYFEEKWNETMYVSVSLSPLDISVFDKYEIDPSEFHQVSLDCLTYFNSKN